MKKFAVLASLLVLATVANASITASVAPVFHGNLSTGAEVYSYDLQVTITGSDAWTVAGGPVVGAPWITLAGGTFYNSAMNDSNPPAPDFFPFVPDSQWTSFYTTHLGYPNTAAQGVSPGFGSGPGDTATALQADWFWTPNGNDYPGTFTIARFTIIEDVAGTAAVGTINMQVGSRTGGVIPFQAIVRTPEPASLALLALGGLALIRRR